MTPGSTTQTKSSGLISLMWFIRASESTMPPRAGTHPPTYPYPAPRAVRGILCPWANRRILATEPVLRGSATASGKPLANHLSPEWLWRVCLSKCNSPRGNKRCNLARVLFARGFIGGTVGRRDQRFGFLRIVIGHLHQDASGGHGVAVHAQRGEFVHHFGRDVGRVEPRPDQLRFGRAETAEDGKRTR